MKNYNIDVNNFDFEKFLKDKELPLSINNEIVVLSFDEYIQTLEKVDQEEAIKIKNELMNKITNI